MVVSDGEEDSLRVVILEGKHHFADIMDVEDYIPTFPEYFVLLVGHNVSPLACTNCDWNSV